MKQLLWPGGEGSGQKNMYLTVPGHQMELISQCRFTVSEKSRSRHLAPERNRCFLTRLDHLSMLREPAHLFRILSEFLSANPEISVIFQWT